MAPSNNLPNYTDFDSLLQVFETFTNCYKNNVLFHYKIPDGGTSRVPEYKTLTYSQVDTITTHLANIWKPMIPPDTSCVAVFNDNPIQATLALFAILKLGLITFPLSPHHTKDVLTHLLIESNTGFFITSKENVTKAIDSVNAVAQQQQQQQRERIAQNDNKRTPVIMDIKIWDQFDDIMEQLLLDTTMSPSNPIHDDSNNHISSYNRLIISAQHDVDSTTTVVYAITSGSTSTTYPKLIHWSTQSIMYMVLEMNIKSLIREGKDDPNFIMQSTDVMIIIATSFLAGASLGELFTVFSVGGSVVLLDDLSKLHPHDFLEVSEMFQVSLMLAPPSFLERLAEYLKTLPGNNWTIVSKTLQRVKYCFYGGLPLQIEIGDYLQSKGLNVRTHYGATETCIMSQANVSRENKNWYKIHPTPELMHYATFEPFDNDMFHLVIHSNFPSLAKNVANRPNGNYATRDLFIKDSPRYWTYVGRMDDIMNLKSGVLVNPIPLETELCKEEIIKKCVIVVHQVIRKVNKTGHYEAAISIPEMIYILPFGKQLPMTAKGAISRKKTNQEFNQEIEQMYTNFIRINQR
ncbi:hypothetical protein BDA99DRAFT_541709 [Phascolomyces articulosus]|uniref:AMP-dependent synthetase/ligase domain-containing protein n=1 Tax=Phascolomyces articulosus TaxID=60185 RepID=A0AAD5K174_9FUNG|nr:hypothetical protein BDA99DRAFT_541709 [Phascolomyces articulosus]